MIGRTSLALLLVAGVAGAQEPPPQQPAYPPPPPPAYYPPPPQAYPPQAYPQQAYPQQAYPQQAYPPQAYPPQAAPPGYYPPPVEPAPHPSSFQARFSAGAGIRTLYDVSLYGGDIEIGLGAQPSDNLAFYGNIGFFFGRTAAGLLAVGFRPGMMVEGVFDRFRFGGGIQFGSITIRRITSGGTLDDFTIGPRLNVSVDLARFGRRGGLYLGVAASLDFLTASNTLRDLPMMVEGQFLLGARF